MVSLPSGFSSGDDIYGMHTLKEEGMENLETSK